MGEKGCRHLSKAAWGELEVIELGDYISTQNRNTIGDRGCWHISGGGWLRVKRVDLSIDQNIAGNCGVREEGCRAMAKRQGHLDNLWCIFVVTQMMETKSE